MNPLTVVPAYGRDYTTQAAVAADWKAHKDFLIQDVSSPHNVRYVNDQQAAQLAADGYTHVRVRYAKRTKFTLVKVA